MLLCDNQAMGLSPVALMVAPAATWMLPKLNTAICGLKLLAWACSTPVKSRLDAPSRSVGAGPLVSRV